MTSDSFRNSRLIRLVNILLIALLLASIPGCSSLSDKPEESVEELARQGIAKYKVGKYPQALEIFTKIKEHHPFSRYGLLAELKSADCHFFMKEYEEARPLYEEFEKNHPTNEAIPYVLFQIGLCHFKKIDTVDRDPAGATDSIQAFSRLIKSFPDSTYVTEATIKTKKAKNFLAAHELYVANYYNRVNSYSEARGRLKYILATYPDSPSAAEAASMLAALPPDEPKKTDEKP